jgi:3-deoxy-D-manno-octulosonic-acid transferase
MPNIKFDRLASATATDDDPNKINNIVPRDRAFVVLASVRREEEPLVNKIVQKLLHKQPQAVIGLFPRHLHRIQAWQEILNHAGIRWALRSKTKTQVTAGTVVLWDTFGEMLPAFKLCKSAFVGGSLAPLGGQNFLEALVSGVLPVIGPSWENFSWVGDEIVDSGLLRIAADWEEVAACLLKDMDRPSSREDVINRTLEFIKTHQGGTAKACREIAACLEGS